MASTSYELGRLAPACAATGAPLTPGAPFVTALSESAEGGLLRHDYSLDAWENGARPPGLFAFWRGVVPEPTRSKGPVLDAPALLDLFEQLSGSTEPRQISLRSILCLILVRKRLLQIVGQREGLTLVRPKGAAPEDPPIEVADPTLDAQALAEVTAQLQALLGIDP